MSKKRTTHSKRKAAEESPDIRLRRRVDRIIRRAMSGDVDAIQFLLQATGELPDEDTKRRDML